MNRLLGASVAAAALLAGAIPAHAQYVKPALAHEPYGDVHLVVPITSGDAGVWHFRLGNLGAAVAGVKEFGGKLQARVVLYGGGVGLLTQSDEALRHTIDELRGAGVQFEVCNNTLKGRNLDWHQLYGVKEADVVPSGFLEVAWLGQHGWSVDPMN
jgi:hypothetical protein